MRARTLFRRGDGGRRPVPAPTPDLSRLLERLNPPTLARATGHEVILHRHLAALGLSVPRLHGVIGRAGGWNASTDRPVLGPEAAGRFLAGLTDDIVVRPSAASRDDGVRVLRRDGSQFVDLEGRRHEPSAVAAEACSDPRFELFVVVGRVAPHPRLRGLVPDGGLPTARLTTFVPDDGPPQVVHACLMRPAPDAPDGSATGRVIAEVDPSTGALEPQGSAPAAAWDEGDLLPDWGAACDLARRGAALLMPQRTVAWDIALAPDGPVVVGADSRYERIGSLRFTEALRAMERAADGGGPVTVGGAA